MLTMLDIRSVSAVATAVTIALGGCTSIDLDAPVGRDGGFDRRVYVGAGALVSRLEPDADDEPDIELDEDQSVGGSLAIGYDLSERLSVEGHLAQLGEATFAPEGDVTYQVGGLSALVYGLNDVHGRLLREGFSVFGRVGAGTMRNQADDVEFERENDLHLLFGGGVEFGFENGLAVRGELVSHETDAGYAQLGLLYRFGEAYTSARRADAPLIPDGAEGVVTSEAGGPDGSATEALDGDADGVPDVSDDCSGTSAAQPVDASGCALFEGVIDGVAFESGSATLTAEAQEVLAALAADLAEHPGLVVAVDAHTDNRGSADGNLELSRLRALAVARLLASEGVEPGRIKPRAYGESRPRVSNATLEGRAENRRVEISVVR